MSRCLGRKVGSTLHIVHISTVHSALDPRIRLKQLRSVRDGGLTAHLVTADRDAGEEGDGVRVHRVAGRRRGRLTRMLITAPRAVLRAIRIPAAVYHFHDPELIPWAWLLLLRGVPVVYDVHEDYALAVAHKPYLAPALRSRLGRLVAAAERVLTRPFRVVIAEECYAPRFPAARAVLNYPSRSLLSAGSAFGIADCRLLYTGNVTADRGALNLARLARVLPEAHITMAGRCDPAVAAEIRAVAGMAASRITLTGEGRYVPFAEIRSLYWTGHWIAGIALIPDSPHYREKQLTKFFEYMAAGLPIIASDVPAWRSLIAAQGLGLCVDPEDPRAVAEAVRWIEGHPEAAREMGTRGRDFVALRYNWEREGQRLLSFYHELLEAS